MVVNTNGFLRVACLALVLGCSSKTPEGAGADASDSGGAGGGANGGSSPVAGTGGGASTGGTGGSGTGGSGGASGSAPAIGGTGGSSEGGAGGTTGGSAGSSTGGTGNAAGSDAGSSGAPEPGSRAAERARLGEKLAEVEGLDAAGLLARYPTSFEAAPTYEASAIAGLDAIQASRLSLTEAEQQALVQKGFVVSGSRTFPTFGYGYATIYSEDLPVYVSADSILESVHRSFDAILRAVETNSLMAELTTVLDGMRARLQAGAGAELGEEVRADADVFLAVAASLLAGQPVAPVAGGSEVDIASFVELATLASGTASVSLFGVTRQDEDFSQFKPRGHYTRSPELARYFKAMMWLGRIDFRLVETQPGGARTFQRRPLEAMLLMNALVDDELRPHFDTIDRTIGHFVGEPDYMELSEVGSLLEDVGVTDLAGVAGVSDEAFERAILDGDYGTQQIASHVMMNGLAAPGTLPLSLSFALLGQRYVIDSHVFSNVVYDRAGGGQVARLMPNPLDVAFAVLKDDQAAALLAPELERYPYAADLAAMRVLADEHPPEFWNGTLYNLWLGALRELAPAAIAKSADAAGLPATFRSEAWGRHLLQTKLASWAELRHDTILYTKQSYTSGQQCEFPDGYVDPYPELYSKLMEYAARGKETIPSTDVPMLGGVNIAAYFDNLLLVATRLRDMAMHQRTGAPYTQEMLDFLNDAVVFRTGGCGPDTLESGWYSKLYVDRIEAAEWAPTIADVHTQPFDEGGAPVGKVLHVGTGDARQMVVVADTCSGPRAYVGLASSYYEHVTSDYERLDDKAWAGMVRAEPDVPWAADLTTH